MSQGIVLVVDDSADWREELGELVQEYGYTAIPADNLESAMQVVDSQRLDVAIIDINLTDEIRNIDGLRLHQHIQEQSPDVKVILISARQFDPTEKTSDRPLVFVDKSRLWPALNQFFNDPDLDLSLLEFKAL